MAQNLLERLNLDDVLGKFNVYGRYHAVSAVFLTLGIVFNTFWTMSFIFVVQKVGYRCADNDNLLSVEDPNSTLTTTEAWCRNPGSCSQWIYDNPNSFVAEFHLACQEWKMTSVGSIHSIGFMVGLLIIGPLSDRFGRKVLIGIAGLTGGILGVAKSFATSYWVYLVLDFCEASLGDPISPIFTLAMEIAATKSRVKYLTVIGAGFSGYAILPLFAWLFPYWRTLLRVLYAPALLFIYIIYVLDESPRWLLSKGKKKEAVAIIRSAAKKNKIIITENLDMLSYEKDEQLSFVTVIRDTFRSRLLLKRFAICSIWWITFTFVAHGLIINSVSLVGNKYVNFALSGVVRLPSSFLTGYVLTKFHRKGPLIFFFAACGVMCVGQPHIPKSMVWLLIPTYLAGKLAAAAVVNIVYIYTSELFPTYTRNSMHALCSSVGRIGAILAPQTPLLMAYWSGLPTTLFGAMALVAALATLLMPDTAEVNLPDTVCQAEALEDLTRVKS